MKSIIRQRLLGTTLLVGLMAAASPALAQNTDEPEGETIIVTGSRIASPIVSSASPLQIVDAQQIQESGVVNLQTILLENPAMGTPTLSRTNSNFLTSGAGVATIDLRNLGTDRTLVLINGHRTVAGLPGGATVDINTIPTQFIERVDILTGGASSIYGSDAVAGVVNINYRKSFQGLELNAQTGITEQGDGANYQLNATMGTNFADDRGNVMVHIGYSKEEAIYTGQRSDVAIDQNACYQISNAQGGCSTEVNSGDNTRLFERYLPFLSGFNPGGTITFGGISRTVLAGGVLVPVNTNGLVHADGVPSTVRACTTADPCRPSLAAATGFNRSAFRTIAVPVERYLLAFRGNYAVTDSINATLEGNFAKSSSTTLIEPFPFQTSGVNGTAPNACTAGVAQTICGGYHPIESRVNGVVVRNPFVPDAIYNAATDITGDGLRDISFTRRLSDFGPRTYTADRQTYRLFAGLDGDIGSRWKWEAFFSFGETIESQVGSGQVNLNNFTNALEVIPGPNGPICASAVARAQGCRPANIFGGPGSIDAAAANYIQAAQTRNVRVNQTVAGASLSGTVVDLWDGPLGVAIGGEYRKETSRSTNDPLTIAGLNGGNALQPTAGEFTVKEAYGEVEVPLLADRPFFQALTLRAAGRISDYSLTKVGTVYSWNYGGEYAPVEDVRFRVVRARAIRAPNIGELFGGRSQTFPTGLVDPCAGVTAVSTGAVSVNCRAAAGVNANITANGSFTLNQSDLQGISGFGQGNPNLGEETGDTFTAGVVINPRSIRALRNFELTVDYFNIRIKDAINATPRQFILNQCYQVNDPFYCAQITRRAAAEGPNSAGSLQFIDSSPTNSGGTKTSGIDATLGFRQNMSDWGLGEGTLRASVSYTHVITFTTQPTSQSPVDPLNGEVGASRDRASVSVAYANSLWGITLRGNYIGAAYLDDSFTGEVAGTPAAQDYRIAPVVYLHSQIRFTPGESYELYLGVDNLLGKKPPLIVTGLPGGNTGVETDAGTYDAIGRRFYAGARLKF